MTEYIEREKLPQKKERGFFLDDDFNAGWNACLNKVNSIPAADVVERNPLPKDAEELVERLKIAADWAGKGFCITPSLFLEAADAIEKLQEDSVPIDDMEMILSEVAKPHWIPVTEALPECEWGAEVGNIEWISCGMVFAGCFGRGGKYRDAYFRTWTDAGEGMDAKGADYWRAVTLPEPPKEET